MDCIPETSTAPCGDAPANSRWVVGWYSRTWSVGGWNPSSAPGKKCVTSNLSTDECSFICNDDYVCNGNE